MVRREERAANGLKPAARTAISLLAWSTLGVTRPFARGAHDVEAPPGELREPRAGLVALLAPGFIPGCSWRSPTPVATPVAPPRCPTPLPRAPRRAKLARMVRGRFAPSPTGALHLGNARTALLAWLHARAHGGAFVMRVEDLDFGRVRPGIMERQLDELRWLGLDWDEGPDVGGPYAPYIQSQRQERYDAALRTAGGAGAALRVHLLAQGHRPGRQRAARGRRGAALPRHLPRPPGGSRRPVADRARARRSSRCGCGWSRAPSASPTG